MKKENLERVEESAAPPKPRRILLFKTKVALVLWLKHGLQWRDQYMKFGPVMAWKMAEYILEFRRSSKLEVR